MSATIKDLARKLNLSISTVSYALNNGPKPVSADVRDRVLTTAREMGYRPNRLAKSLVTRRTHSVGIVLPNIARNVMLSQFMQLALNGIVNAAEELHQDVVILTAYDRTDPNDLAIMAHDPRVDGVVYLAPRLDASLHSLDVPMAVVSSSRSSIQPAYTADNELGIRSAVDHLVSLGHRKIAHIRSRYGTADGDERCAAFLDALSGHGLQVPEEYIQHGDFRIEGGQIATEILFGLPQPPTAIVCGNDEIAFGAYLHAEANNISIPNELSVIGFDDTPLGARLQPSLTSIRQPIEQMGTAACHAVVQQAAGKSAFSQQFATELIIRGSTARPMEKRK